MSVSHCRVYDATFHCILDHHSVLIEFRQIVTSFLQIAKVAAITITLLSPSITFVQPRTLVTSNRWCIHSAAHCSNRYDDSLTTSAGSQEASSSQGQGTLNTVDTEHRAMALTPVCTTVQPGHCHHCNFHLGASIHS